MISKIYLHSAPEVRKLPSVRLKHSSRKPGKTPWLLLCMATLAAGFLCWWAPRELFLETRAAAGEIEAQYLLGRRCFTRASCQQGYVTGLTWLAKAAHQDHTRAQTALGVVYARGLGVQQRPDLALEWLSKAASRGTPLAQNELATLYAGGRGVPQDLEKAIYWYRQSAASGAEIAERNLVLATAAKAQSIGDVTTKSGRSYQQVSLTKIEHDGIMVAFKDDNGSFGLAKLRAEDLPRELALLCKKDASYTKSRFRWSRLDVIEAGM